MPLFSTSDNVLYGEWSENYGMNHRTIIIMLEIIRFYQMTLYKFQCEQIADDLYGIKWYMMPPQYHKQLKAVVHRWQQGLAITIGPFEPLNYETATNVRSVSATACQSIFWNLEFIFSFHSSPRKSTRF